MKKIIFILAILMTVSTLKASDCGVCGQEPWMPHVKTYSFGPCLITVEFSTRDCMPLGRDLRLDKITTSDDCFLNQDMAIEYATRYLLNNSFEIFGVFGVGEMDLRFSTECCWDQTGGLLGGTSDVYEPCPEQDCCCEMDITMKKHIEFGIEKGRFIKEKSMEDDGSASSCASGCDKVCDVLDDLQPYSGSTAPVYTGNCDVDCQSNWYTAGSNVVSKTYGSICSVEVYYQYRECSGDIEVKFSAIEYSGNDCGGKDDMLKEAIEGILAQIGSIFGPTTVQVRIGTCWEFETVGSSDFLKSCYADDCCVAEYTLVDDGSGGSQISFATTNITSRYSICAPSSTCTFICDNTHLGVTEGQTLSKRAAEKVEGNLFETSSNVVPNPANESITIKVNSRFNGNMSISITDINGKVVYMENLNKTTQSIDRIINIKELTTGTYYYTISAGIHDIDGGKFIKQ